MNSAMWGYMIGSPTSDSAQCFSASASATRSCFTPSHPANCFTSRYDSCHALSATRWFVTMPLYTSSALSVFHRHARPVGLEWCRQQNRQRFAQAIEGDASMHDALFCP